MLNIHLLLVLLDSVTGGALGIGTSMKRETIMLVKEVQQYSYIPGKLKFPSSGFDLQVSVSHDCRIRQMKRIVHVYIQAILYY